MPDKQKAKVDLKAAFTGALSSVKRSYDRVDRALGNLPSVVLCVAGLFGAAGAAVYGVYNLCVYVDNIDKRELEAVAISRDLNTENGSYSLYDAHTVHYSTDAFKYTADFEGKVIEIYRRSSEDTQILSFAQYDNDQFLDKLRAEGIKIATSILAADNSMSSEQADLKEEDHYIDAINDAEVFIEAHSESISPNMPVSEQTTADVKQINQANSGMTL